MEINNEVEMNQNLIMRLDKSWVDRHNNEALFIRRILSIREVVENTPPLGGNEVGLRLISGKAGNNNQSQYVVVANNAKPFLDKEDIRAKAIQSNVSASDNESAFFGKGICTAATLLAEPSRREMIIGSKTPVGFHALSASCNLKQNKLDVADVSIPFYDFLDNTQYRTVNMLNASEGFANYFAFRDDTPSTPIGVPETIALSLISTDKISIGFHDGKKSDSHVAIPSRVLYLDNLSKFRHSDFAEFSLESLDEDDAGEFRHRWTIKCNVEHHHLEGVRATESGPSLTGARVRNRFGSTSTFSKCSLFLSASVFSRVYKTDRFKRPLYFKQSSAAFANVLGPFSVPETSYHFRHKGDDGVDKWRQFYVEIDICEITSYGKLRNDQFVAESVTEDAVHHLRLALDVESCFFLRNRKLAEEIIQKTAVGLRSHMVEKVATEIKDFLPAIDAEDLPTVLMSETPPSRNDEFRHVCNNLGQEVNAKHGFRNGDVLFMAVGLKGEGDSKKYSDVEIDTYKRKHAGADFKIMPVNLDIDRLSLDVLRFFKSQVKRVPYKTSNILQVTVDKSCSTRWLRLRDKGGEGWWTISFNADLPADTERVGRGGLTGGADGSSQKKTIFRRDMGSWVFGKEVEGKFYLSVDNPYVAKFITGFPRTKEMERIWRELYCFVKAIYERHSGAIDGYPSDRDLYAFLRQKHCGWISGLVEVDDDYVVYDDAASFLASHELFLEAKNQASTFSTMLTKANKHLLVNSKIVEVLSQSCETSISEPIPHRSWFDEDGPGSEEDKDKVRRRSGLLLK